MSRGTSNNARRVALFSAGIGLAAGLICVFSLAHVGALPGRTHLSWWVLAIGFAAADVVLDVHIDVNRDTYTISLMEIPLVLGLFLASPLAMILGRLAGAGAALAVYRRQPLRKLFFNVSLFALEAAVAVVVFRALAGSVSGVGPGTWAPAFAAALAANLVSVAAVLTVIALNGGTAGDRDRRFVAAVMIPPVANTSLALGAAALLWSEPAGAWLLGAIALVLVAAYRAYAALNQRYANLQRLYEFTGAVQHAPSGPDAVIAILDAARRLLRAGVAELALLDEPDQETVRISRCTATSNVTHVPVPTAELGALWQRAVTGGVSVIATHGSRDPGREDLARIEHKDVLIVPLRREERVAGAMLVADREGDVGTFDRDDLRFFETVVNHAAVALERSRLVDELEYSALHDALTGMPNRSLFDARVREATRTRPLGKKFAVLLMDLDRFKEVNDTLGHHHGDRLLSEVGSRLATSLPPAATIARFGGDEFAILVPDVEDAEDALRVARHVRELVSFPFSLDDLAVDVGASIGIAVSPDHGEEPTTLLQRADVAMYSAKQHSGVELYSSERDHYSPRRLALVAELKEAMAAEGLDVYYQPKADLATGRVTGAEALLRWPHPEYGFVPPDEFIPIAEHTGLIKPITVYVLARAVRQLSAWQAEGLALSLSVNVSVRNLADLELIEDIRRLVEAERVPRGRLTLEITETSLMSDPEGTVAVLEEIAAMGIRLSVDDFGTGYSSLAYLKRLPVTEVKIDKSFVMNMEADHRDQGIVRSIVDLGSHLGLRVVAEGVESRATWDALAAMGCESAQGYWLSRPVPADAFAAWLRDRAASAAEAAEERPGGHGPEVVPLRALAARRS